MHIILTLQTSRDTILSVAERLLSDITLALSVLFVYLDTVFFHGQYQEFFLIAAAVVLDAGLGVASAWRTGTLNSRDLYRTVPKMLTYFAMYIGALLIDATLPLQLRLASGFTAFFIVSTEVLSFFEHAALLGFSTPSGLIKRLKLMRDSDSLRV